MRTVAAALLVLAPLACGDGDSSSPAAGGSAPPPAEPTIDLAIDRVDDRRFVVPADALVAVAAEATAGKVDAVVGGGALTLTRIPAGGALSQLGFAAGDRLTRIDGEPIATLADLRTRYQRSLDRGYAELELERDGAPLRRRYYWRESLETDERDGEPTDAEQQLFAAVKTGVRQVEPGAFEIDELVVQALTADSGLARAGSRRAVGGSGAGVTGPPGVLAAIGLTPYDVIKTVDDRDVVGRHSLDRAFAGIGDARSFSLSIIRLSEPMVIRYRVVRDLVMDADLGRALAAWRDEQDRLPKPRRRGRLPAPGATPARAFTGVDQLADDHWAIERSAVRDVLASTSRLARVVPYVKNGEPHGIKIYGIRRTSPLGAIGLKNGDNLIEVDGRQLASVDDLRALETVLAKPGEIEVQLIRRGKPVALRYTIR